MYLVNTSFSIEPHVLRAWLEIIKEDYIPLLERGGFRVVALSRVISAEAVAHFTYSLLVEVADMARYKELTEDVFGEYLAIAGPLFGTDVMWFTSLMKKEL